MPFLYGQCQTGSPDDIEIKDYTSAAESLTIPAYIDGHRVRRIASHAFEGRSDIKEVRLPDTIRELGSFAFHNNKSLRQVTMYDSVQDYAHGVLRHCAHLEQIILHSGGTDFSLLKQLLDAHEESLTVTLHMPDTSVRLSFPDFALIASENTMARTIQFAFEGGGYAYRECVRKREIRFREYDSLFPFMEHDDPSYASVIAVDRLMYPMSLDDRDREQYLNFLCAHDSEALMRFVRTGDTERTQWLLGQNIAGAGAIDQALRLASDMKKAEVCALLMDAGREAVPSTAGSHAGGGIMELEDW